MWNGRTHRAATEIDIAPVTHDTESSAWQQWLHRPEKLSVHRPLFQIHLWLGMLAGLYILIMSISGSMIVFRNQLEGSADQHPKIVRIVEWAVNLHDNLLLGTPGRTLNGICGICLTLLCLTGAVLWWPGIAHWRRSMGVNWKASSARINWDLHNALGFWCFFFLLVWGISGIYFAFPDTFNALVDFLEPSPRPNTDQLGQIIILCITNLHFGRFGWFVESLWVALGLVPAVLAFTGIFMCCHRIFVRKGASLRQQ